MSFEGPENPLFLCGHSAEEVLQLGYEFYFRNVPEKTLALPPMRFDFMAQLLPAEKKTLQYHSMTFTRSVKKVCILINHKLTPLFNRWQNVEGHGIAVSSPGGW